MSTGTYMNQHTILERRNRLVTSRNQTHEGVMLTRRYTTILVPK